LAAWVDWLGWLAGLAGWVGWLDKGNWLVSQLANGFDWLTGNRSRIYPSVPAYQGPQGRGGYSSMQRWRDSHTLKQIRHLERAVQWLHAGLANGKSLRLVSWQLVWHISTGPCSPGATRPHGMSTGPCLAGATRPHGIFQHAQTRRCTYTHTHTRTHIYISHALLPQTHTHMLKAQHIPMNMNTYIFTHMISHTHTHVHDMTCQQIICIHIQMFMTCHINTI